VIYVLNVPSCYLINSVKKTQTPDPQCGLILYAPSTAGHCSLLVEYLMPVSRKN